MFVAGLVVVLAMMSAVSRHPLTISRVIALKSLTFRNIKNSNFKRGSLPLSMVMYSSSSSYLSGSEGRGL